MACELCGGGDAWIKTCLTPEGSRLLVCDPCYGEHAAELTVVPGHLVVTARCESCGVYGNPREYSGIRLGGRKGAYSGTCVGCTREEWLRNPRDHLYGTAPIEGLLNTDLPLKTL